MKRNELKAQVAIAVRACQGKKAADISILRLDEQASGFTDYFVVCSGANPRQVQAIADEVDEKLSATGVEPSHREGYTQADWVLLDYVDFVVHIFSETARKFYDLERLWKTATRLQLADLEKPARKPAAKKTPAGAKRAKAAKSATKSAAKSRAKSAAGKRRSSTARSRKSS
ncbi:MAG: ribosome silencing factor [Candidatus Korobacteraceae bacterium]